MANTVNPLRRSILKLFGSGAALASTGVSATAIGSLSATESLAAYTSATATYNGSHVAPVLLRPEDAARQYLLHSDMTSINEIMQWLTAHENYDEILRRHITSALVLWLRNDLFVPDWWFNCRLNDHYKIRRLALERFAQEILKSKIGMASCYREDYLIAPVYILNTDPPQWVHSWMNNPSATHDFPVLQRDTYKHKPRAKK